MNNAWFLLFSIGIGMNNVWLLLFIVKFYSRINVFNNESIYNITRYGWIWMGGYWYGCASAEN